MSTLLALNSPRAATSLVLTLALAGCASSPQAMARDAAAGPETLNLAFSTIEAVRKHIGFAEALKSNANDEQLCRLTRSSLALQAMLGHELNEQHRGRLASGSEFNDWSDAVGVLDASIVGVGLTVGAERMRASVRFDELAVHAPSANTRALLNSTDALFPHNGWPVYFEPITDVAACARPSALAAHLADVSLAWPEAPKCLQELLAEAIDEAVQKATTHACQCEEQVSTRAAVRALQRFLENTRAANPKLVALAPTAAFACQGESSQ